MYERCIVISKSGNRLLEDALSLCRMHFRTISVFTPDNDISNEKLGEEPWDLLVSFLSEKIIRGKALNRPNLNFHPAPPEYPGRGAASYALFDGAENYGAVAHSMNEGIDSGAIRAARRFPIGPHDTCETLFAKAERICVDLLDECLQHFSRSGALPETNEKWLGQARTRKQFLDWLVLDPSDRDTFLRKVRAAAHSKFPGPYVELHGHRFALNADFSRMINLPSSK